MSEWKNIPIRDLFDYTIAGEWGSKPLPENSIPVLRSTNFTNSGKLDLHDIEMRTVPKNKLEKRLIRCGDTLMEKSGGSPGQPAGRVVYADVPFICTCSNFIELCRPNSAYDALYIFFKLFYCYNTGLINRYQQQTTGLINFKLDQYLDEQIDVPSEKNEQRKIARILSTVDSVIERTEAAIAKYTAIKQGMMHDLFTRGIVLKTGKLRPKYEDAPELYKKTELGMVPKEWEVVQISSFCDIKGGKRLPAGSDFADGITKFPYLRVTDMVDGTINQTELKYVPVCLEPFIRPYKIYKHDVYVTIAGTLGLFGTIPDNLDGAQLTENAARLTNFDEDIYDRDFIKYQCNSDIIQNQLRREIGVGGGVPKLALFRIGRFAFLKPNKEEQELITVRIRCADINLLTVKCELGKFKEVKLALMSVLLTGRKRVKYTEETTEAS